MSLKILLIWVLKVASIFKISFIKYLEIIIRKLGWCRRSFFCLLLLPLVE